MVSDCMKERFKRFKEGQKIDIRVTELPDFVIMIRLNIGLSKYTMLQNGDFMSATLDPEFNRFTR
jgi:hypothetical protein